MGLCRLAVPILGRAFLQERTLRFGSILRLGQEHLLTVFYCKCRFKAWRIDIAIEGIFAQAKAHRCSKQHFSDDFLRCVIQFIRLDDGTDKAGRKRSFSMNEASREDHLAGQRRANKPRQEIARSHVAATKTDFDIGGVHSEIGRAKTDVARQEQGESATTRRPLRQSDDRLRAGTHKLHDGRDAALRPPSVLNRADTLILWPCAKVETCAKCPALGLEDHNADIVPVVERLKTVAKRKDEGLIHRIQPLRAVKRNRGDRTVFGYQDWVGHE